MYLRDERLRLYQASLEVTVTINRLQSIGTSIGRPLLAISVILEVQDIAYVTYVTHGTFHPDVSTP